MTQGKGTGAQGWKEEKRARTGVGRARDREGAKGEGTSEMGERDERGTSTHLELTFAIRLSCPAAHLGAVHSAIRAGILPGPCSRPSSIMPQTRTRTINPRCPYPQYNVRPASLNLCFSRFDVVVRPAGPGALIPPVPPFPNPSPFRDGD